MFFKMTTADFQSIEGNYDIITVRDGIIYFWSYVELEPPFEKIEELPAAIKSQFEIDLGYNKNEKKEQLEKIRDESTEYVEYNGHSIQADDKSVSFISAAISLYSNVEMPCDSIKFITKDNEIVDFTKEDLVNIMSIIMQNKIDAAIECRLEKDKMIQLNTVNEVQSFKVENEIQ